ncbi:MAG: Hsp20/alpha crystallin family protein [Bacteroidota bacterium]
MTLVRTSNYPSFSSLFDDFFNTEVGDWKRQNFSSTQTTLPKVNIKEDHDAFVVEMAAPGMSKGDFNIELDNNLLTISSEKQEETKNEDEKYSRKEFSYQSFQRSFTLPESADGEKISASYENGILHVGIPKKEEAKPKPAKTISIT